MDILTQVEDERRRDRVFQANIDAQARLIISDAQHTLRLDCYWTQRADGRDDDGNPISGTNPDAVCWCLTGALVKAAQYRSASAYERALQAICDANNLIKDDPDDYEQFDYERYLFNLNDNGAHSDVTSALDNAWDSMKIYQ